MRAATLTTSPVTRNWLAAPVSATASPLLMPTHAVSAAHLTISVVVVRALNAEHYYDRIADDLLDGAAVTLGYRAHPVEVPSHRRPYELCIVLGAKRGRPDGIGEQYRNELPLLR